MRQKLLSPRPLVISFFDVCETACDLPCLKFMRYRPKLVILCPNYSQTLGRAISTKWRKN